MSLTAEPAAIATSTLPARRVVVADDTAFVRDRFRVALQSAGHIVSTVSSGAELLTLARQDREPIDLVVLDLRMPQAQGVAVVRALRGIQGFRAPIVVFSGTIANAQEVRELAALGVAGYINEYSAVQHIMPALAPHVFPDKYNRRASPRVILGISVSYRVGNSIGAALTLNVSNGGLAVRTTSPLDTGADAKVRLRLPGTSKDIEADCRVVWSDRRTGMGLRFTNVEHSDQAIVETFVKTHFFSNRKA